MLLSRLEVGLPNLDTISNASAYNIVVIAVQIKGCFLTLQLQLNTRNVFRVRPFPNFKPKSITSLIGHTCAVRY